MSEKEINERLMRERAMRSSYIAEIIRKRKEEEKNDAIFVAVFFFSIMVISFLGAYFGNQ